MASKEDLILDKIEKIDKKVDRISENMVTKEMCQVKQNSLKNEMDFKKVSIICTTISGSLLAIVKLLEGIFTKGGFL